MSDLREVQLVVELSDGRKVTFDVTIPKDATPIRTSFQDTASPSLRWANGGWQCWSPNVAQSKLLGYCCQHRVYLENIGGPTWEELSRMPGSGHYLQHVGSPEEWERNRATRLSFEEKYHFEGHSSEQEAIRCYRQFLFDQCRTIVAGDVEQECSGCGTATRQTVDFDSPVVWPVPLCAECSGASGILKALALA